MKDDARPPLPKYAKYLPDYELPPPAARVKTMSPQAIAHLKIVSLMLGIMCGISTVYLIASLVIAPHAPDPDLSVDLAEVTWVPFGLLPGLSALICWSICKARDAAQD